MIGSARIVLATLLMLFCASAAAEAVLKVRIGTEQRSFTTSQLLALADTRTITVTDDVAYPGAPRQYRAVPVKTLLRGLRIDDGYVVQARADDGFVAQLPTRELLDAGPERAEAWLAIEPADAPWPALAGKSRSAGPFYLVWLRPQASGIRSEQWPYQLAELSALPAPLSRWPVLDVAADLPADAPARRGLTLFLTQCLVCHRLNGGGAAEMGPDLNLPMNPTEYFTDAALRALIRDPAAVRDWPGRQMQGFTAEQLSDGEIDDILAYLKHMAGRKAR